MGLNFRGEYLQKVDGKGRVSIPAGYRRVLETGDPDFPQNPNPRVVILYGQHLKNNLRAYSIEAMMQLEQEINDLPRGSKKRQVLSRLVLGKSLEIEVDRDGRIVLPKERREQIGLEGDCIMTAMGEFFEIWRPDNFEAATESEIDEFLDEMPPDTDIMSLLS